MQPLITWSIINQPPNRNQAEMNWSKVDCGFEMEEYNFNMEEYNFNMEILAISLGKLLSMVARNCT